MSEVIVVLSDDYFFGAYSIEMKPNTLKEGGFFLIARPEARVVERNLPEEKLSIGKLGKLLGALNKEEFWIYESPKEEKTQNSGSENSL